MTYKSALALVCAAVVTTAVAKNAAAQEAPSKPTQFGGAAYLMPGVRGLDLGALNDRLSQNGYGKVGQPFASIGGGGHMVLGRVRIGGEGHFLAGVGGDAVRGSTRANVSGGYGMFRLGFAVIQTERFSLYPMLGIGGGGLSVDFRQKGLSDFDQVLADPRRDATLSRGGLLFDAALGADYRVALTRKAGSEGFMMLGLRGSYTYSPSMGGWSTAGGSVAGGPDLGITGPSLHVLVGFGGMGASQ